MILDLRTKKRPRTPSILRDLLVVLPISLLACTTNEMNRLSSDVIGDLSHGLAPRGAFDARLVDACGPAGNTRAGDAALLRQPYLQQVTARSALVMWTAEGARPTEVRVSRPGGAVVARAPATVDASAPLPRGSQYTARIEGLEPEQIHCYEIVGEDGAWTSPTGFVTAPPDGARAPVRFAALGDLGIRGVDQWAVAEQLRTVASDFVIITGDLGYESGKLRELEQNFFGVYAPLLRHVPVFPASGNHEYHTGDAIPFRQVFALFENGGDQGRERWYSFDWGNVHVAVLDTEVFLDQQAEWLDDDLARSTAEWNIVVGHRPPFSSGYHGSNLTIRRTFVPIFERHGVDLVLLGHEHHYERTSPINGVTYVVTGGGGRGTRPTGTSMFTAVASQVAHFVYVVVEGPVLTLHAIDGTGKQFDSLRLEQSI